MLLALMEWGERHRTKGASAPRAVHRGCGGELTQRCTCSDCASEVGVDGVELRYDRVDTRAA